MEVVLRYTTISLIKKTFYNINLKKKNDSDINIEIKKKNKIIKYRKYYRNKTFSKNLILLNFDSNTISSDDIYCILYPFIPKNRKLITVSIVSYSKNCSHSSDYKDFIFGLIECDSIKTSKAIFRQCNKLELIGLNFFIDIKFIYKLNRSCLNIIDCTLKKPNNYFPKFIKIQKNHPNSICLELIDKDKIISYKKLDNSVFEHFSSLDKTSLFKQNRNEVQFNKFLDRQFLQPSRHNFTKNFVWTKDILSASKNFFRFKNTDFF